MNSEYILGVVMTSVALIIFILCIIGIIISSVNSWYCKIILSKERKLWEYLISRSNEIQFVRNGHSCRYFTIP